MRFVELKSQDQLDMQTLRRSRDRLVGERTALINQLRAILLERGMVAPQGKRKLEQFLGVLMDEQGGAGLSLRMIVLVGDARAQWAELDRRISAFDAEFVRWVKDNEEARRLTTIPGVGPIVASALVAAVGRAESFDRGRDLAAWLGLVPRQFTTGGKPSCSGSASAATNIRPPIPPSCELLPRDLLAFRAGLGKTDGNRLLFAFYGLAASAALERAGLAALHCALNVGGRGPGVSGHGLFLLLDLGNAESLKKVP